MERFWMVLRDGSEYTKLRHTSYAHARNEAERLSKVHPGCTFIVLEAMSTVKSEIMYTTQHEGCFEVPF